MITFPDDLWTEWIQTLHTLWSWSANPPFPQPPTIRLLTGLPQPQVRTHSFEGTSPLWPPLPGKAIKLSFSTSSKILVPEIQLYTCFQRSNFRLQKLEQVSLHSETGCSFVSQSLFLLVGGGGGQEANRDTSKHACVVSEVWFFENLGQNIISKRI